MSLSIKIKFFLIFVISISVQATKTSMMNLELRDYSEYITPKNGLIALGSILGTYGLFVLVSDFSLKIKGFMELVKKEREKRKVREKKIENKYKIAGLIGKPAVTMLDKFYAAKVALGKKLAVKMLARTVASFLP